MYTLDGRIRFDLALPAEHEQAFHEKKLREVVLSRRPDGVFELLFDFIELDDDEPAAKIAAVPRQRGDIPTYIKLEVPA